MPVNYDIVVSSPFPNYDFFSHRMMEQCGQMNLTYFMVNDVWINEFLEKVESGDVVVRVLLDLTANQPLEKDPYTRLAKAVKKLGGFVMDDPDKTAVVAHKGKFHQILVDKGVPVPETVVVSRDEARRFKITDEIKQRIGVPFVVKPAWGDSGIGVVVNAKSEEDLRRSLHEAPFPTRSCSSKWLPRKSSASISAGFGCTTSAVASFRAGGTRTATNTTWSRLDSSGGTSWRR
ncbi:MAG: hypothetical protein HC807_00820 [Gammaproteobacteria bacterium]|nr:hypothetical protein [Gammaproteobacteria bacterium]